MISFKNFFAAAAVCVAGSAVVAQDVAFDLINNSDSTVYYVYTSPSNSNSWREDVLADDQVISPGYQVTVYIYDGSDQCAYDIKFEFDDGSVMTDEIDVCELQSYTIN
jgi:hypothetical protein